MKRKVEYSSVEFTELVTPEHVDPSEHVYGGTVLCWMDVGAGMVAARHAGFVAVTASVDSVHFLNPIKLGGIAVVKGRVTRAWRTSMEVQVKVYFEHLKSGSRYLCCHAYFTFVGLQNGIPAVVPEVETCSPEELLRFKAADERRKKRFEQKRQSADSPLLLESPYAHASCQLMKIIMPQHSNSVGITFGGQIISWIEHCAYIAATRATRARLITASMDQLQFRRPSKVGDMLIVKAVVSCIFEQSLEVYITVHSERFDSDPVFTNDAWITFVAIDEQESPTPIIRSSDPTATAAVVVVTALDPAHQNEALARKRNRLAEKSQISPVEK